MGLHRTFNLIEARLHNKTHLQYAHNLAIGPMKEVYHTKTSGDNVLDVTRIPALTATLALKHLSYMTLITNNGGMIKG